ncbi:hypothetical protein AT05_09680 [Schleiferia thermophila str. Yellowstone]|nr:hypothetical protein AT05_09680 [Schleiferia thermophila str. Yellowstone]
MNNFWRLKTVDQSLEKVNTFNDSTSSALFAHRAGIFEYGSKAIKRYL